MQHPLQSLSPSQTKKALVLLVAGTLLVMLALGMVDRGLKTEAAPLGIVSFEMVWSATGAQHIIDQWDEAARILAGFSLGLDYLFLPLYSTTIALFLLWKGRGRFVRGLAWAQWVAALLDAVENLCLLLLLTSRLSDELARTATLAAIVKFAIVIAGILVALFSLLFRPKPDLLDQPQEGT